MGWNHSILPGDVRVNPGPGKIFKCRSATIPARVRKARFSRMNKFWQLLFFKVKCRLKSEASTSYLNYGWWVVEPILHMAAFYFVFAVLMNGGTENFVVFLLCGLIPWLWFNKSVSNATASIRGGYSIMMQTRVPISLFPAEIVTQDLVKQLLVFVLLLLFLFLYGNTPTVHWLALAPLILVQLVLVLAVSFLVAMLEPFLPDLRYLVQTGLMLMMFGSGIFYSYDLILPEHRGMFFLNPMANLIKNYREVLMYQHWPDWVALANIFLFSIVVLGLCVLFLQKHRTTYARLVLET